MKIRDSFSNSFKDLRNVSRDDILHRIGLERRHSTAEYIFPALGIFGAGVLLGAGLGLLFAPKRGSDLRDDLGRRIGVGGERGAEETIPTHLQSVRHR